MSGDCKVLGRWVVMLEISLHELSITGIEPGGMNYFIEGLVHSPSPILPVSFNKL